MSSRANKGLAIAMGAIAIVLIVIAALTSSWRVPARDATAPDGVVQSYLNAVFERRSVDAAALLDPAMGCTARNFDLNYIDQSARVDLVEVTVRDTTAVVRVNIQHDNGDPFGGTWTEAQTFDLVRHGATWLITGNAWPVWSCDKVVKS